MGRVTRDRRQARALWEEFREEPAGRSRRIPIRWPKALAVLGVAELIAYRTTHGRRFKQYAHEFAPGSRPLLCAGKDRGQVFLIGDRFKVNAHGIVDLDASGHRTAHQQPRYKVVTVAQWNALVRAARRRS